MEHLPPFIQPLTLQLPLHFLVAFPMVFKIEELISKIILSAEPSEFLFIGQSFR